jgi:hypothetical protein
LLECGFEIVDDFSGENIRIRKVVEFFEALISERKGINASFVPIEKAACPLLAIKAWSCLNTAAPSVL